MAIIEVEAIVAGTQPIDKYAITLGSSSLEKMAEDLLAGRVRGRIEHDPRLNQDRHVVDARVRPVGDTGHFELWVKFHVEEAEWAKGGDRQGMSVAVSAELIEPELNNTRPTVILGIDAGYFPPVDIEAQLASFAQDVNLGRSRTFYLNDAVEVARVVVAFSFVLAPEVVGSGLYDCLKAFLHPKLHLIADKLSRPPLQTEFEFRNLVTEEPGRRTFQQVAILRTGDSEVVKKALETFETISAKGLMASEFNTVTGEWDELVTGEDDGPSRG